MKYNPDAHHRKSIRLKGYDYSSEGLYFITICTQNREHLFGKIVNNKMILNSAGLMIERIYKELSDSFENAQLEEYVIMPNHFHSIIEIIDKVGGGIYFRPERKYGIYFPNECIDKKGRYGIDPYNNTKNHSNI